MLKATSGHSLFMGRGEIAFGNAKMDNLKVGPMPYGFNCVFHSVLISTEKKVLTKKLNIHFLPPRRDLILVEKYGLCLLIYINYMK